MTLSLEQRAPLGARYGWSTLFSMLGPLITGLRLSPFIITLGLWGSLRGLAKGVAHNQSVYPNPPGAWRHTFLSGLISALPPGRQWMILPPGVWLMIVLAILTAAMLR